MPAIMFDGFTEELLALYAPPFRRLGTWRKMRQALRELSELPGVRKTSDLTPLTICQWVTAHPERRAISNASLLISIRSACTYATKMGYLRVNPWDIRKTWIEPDDDDDDEPSQTRHHSIQDIRRILSTAKDEASNGWRGERLHALIACYAYTGMRKSEALGLKVIDLDFNHEIIRIRSRVRRRLKTKKSASPVGMPPELIPIMSQWSKRCGSEWLFPGSKGIGPWTGGVAGYKALDQIKLLGQRAGVPNVTIKSFRNSLATHMRAWGYGTSAIQDQLRHTSPKTQEFYLEEDLADIRSLVSRIQYGT